MAHPALLGQRPLAFFATFQLPRFPPPVRRHAPPAGRKRGIHEEKQVAAARKARFQQKGGVDHRGGELPASGGGERPVHRREGRRVQDPFEAGESLRVREDAVGERAPVDPAAAREDAGAERPGDRRAHGRGVEEPGHDPVAVDQACPLFREEPAHGALAASDPADKTNNEGVRGEG